MAKRFDPCWEKDGYVLRLGRPQEAEEYYRQGFDPVDPETARLTGCALTYPREQVLSFYQKCLEDGDRYDFLICGPDGRILGESVINEIDWEARSANFRIGLFRPDQCGRGIGSWAVAVTRDFAFETLNLHRLFLDVYSINPRAIHVYEKAGFRREGVLRDAIALEEGYADDILMSILEDEWRTMKS